MEANRIEMAGVNKLSAQNLHSNEIDYDNFLNKINYNNNYFIPIVLKAIPIF